MRLGYYRASTGTAVRYCRVVWYRSGGRMRSGHRWHGDVGIANVWPGLCPDSPWGDAYGERDGGTFRGAGYCHVAAAKVPVEWRSRLDAVVESLR